MCSALICLFIYLFIFGFRSLSCSPAGWLSSSVNALASEAGAGAAELEAIVTAGKSQLDGKIQQATGVYKKYEEQVRWDMKRNEARDGDDDSYSAIVPILALVALLLVCVCVSLSFS